ncbi:MAG TPA: phosphate ABC transporter permease PstA [Nitrososphaerales archaeon]|nr:phosphate ABC transporter permease PstA [Nitrososphaerales archaeon]
MEKNVSRATPDPTPTWRHPSVVANHKARTFRSLVFAGLCVACVLAVMIPLGDMLYMFAYRGIQVISIARLTGNPISATPGIGNAITGTAILTALSGAMAIPLGILGGVYMAEFSKGGRFSEALRFCADVLAGVPSIVLGYVCFLAFVVYFNFGYSAMAASIALAIVMFPYVFRTTEIAIRRVPESIKEGAIALGSTKTTMINRLVLRFAMPGILTGVLLALGISLSETAPLLYTANFANYNPTSLFHSQLGYLTGVIYLFYTSNLSFDVQLSYLATFVLIMIVVALNVVARLGLKRFSKV